MAYLTQTSIEEFSGYGYQDFKIAGAAMTATQWATFCTHIVDWTTQLINRWCSVTSFEVHSVVEYHDGKGYSGDGSYEYVEWDKSYYLREPATGVISVEEDINPKTALPAWTTRYERSAATIGDYEVATRGELTKVRFHNNMPSQEQNNLRITYYAGYAAGSVQLNEIQFIANRIAANILTYKKKIQEAQTIRNMGTRDYAQMFEIPDERKIMTEDIRRDLHKYRRYQLGGPTWD